MKKHRLSLSILIICVIIFLGLLGFNKMVIKVAQKIFLPIQSFTYNLGSKINSLIHFSSLKNLQKENSLLKTELSQTLIDQAEFALTRQENVSLKNELNFLSQGYYSNFEIAKIIGRDVLSDQNILIINKGSDSGLVKDSPIIVSGKNEIHGFLVGKIIKIDKTTAKIILITNPKSQTAARTLASQKTVGLLKGEKNLTLKLDLIPSNEKIKTGDILVTSGLEDNIPEGLILGQIIAITGESDAFFNQAKVASLVNFENLRIVTVLKP